ncbi:MAG: branched-chain amino acid ABC transporter substrate-binding protein [Chloroflexi bacterium]|nr:branched-chain amino acid ABC transporter substrate-binding protein [Chloroflexota bacterium]
MKRNIGRFVAFVALVCLALAGCVPVEQMPAGEAAFVGPIKVGMMTVMTGPAASVGMEQRNWAKLAVDEVNKAGGIGGVEVEMVDADTEFDPAKAVLVAERLAADQSIYGIVGPESSQNCAAVATIFEEAGIAYISPSCTKPDLSEQGYETFFRVVPRDDVQGPAGAVFIARDLGARSVFIIDDQSVYSVGLAEEAQKKLQELGVTAIQRESISQKDSDFSALLTRIKAASPDAIYLPIQLAAQGAQIAKQMRELGVEAKLVGSDGLFSPSDFIAGAEGATEGAYVSQFAPDVHFIAEAEATWKAYEAEYGAFGAYGPPAYESMAVLLDAMKRAYEADGAVTRANVLREVQATRNRPGILGFEVTFDDKGDATGASFYIFQVVGDRFELVKKVEME